jgi:hypothetical protein
MDISMETRKPDIRFFNALKKQQTDLINSMNSLISALVSPDNKSLFTCYEQVKNTLKVFNTILPETDQPSWLRSIYNKLVGVEIHGIENISTELRIQWANVIIKNYDMAKKYVWDQNSSNGNNHFLFENICLENYSKTDLPQLYEQLIILLNEMLASNLIDSKEIDQAIHNLIDMLTTNRDSSYFARRYVLTKVAHVYNDIIAIATKSVEGLTQLASHFADCFSKIQISIGICNTNIKTEINNTISNEFNGPKYYLTASNSETEILHITKAND